VIKLRRGKSKSKKKEGNTMQEGEEDKKQASGTPGEHDMKHDKEMQGMMALLDALDEREGELQKALMKKRAAKEPKFSSGKNW